MKSSMNKHINTNIRAVLFDHDDTLVGTSEPMWVLHKFIAKKYYGKDLADEELRRHWGIQLEELVCLLYDSADAKKAMRYLLDHHKAYPKAIFEATSPVLRHLRKNNILTGVVTASVRISFEHDLAQNKVPKGLLDYTQTAEDTAHHKPDPLVFEPALAWLSSQGIKPNEVIYIGDGLHDMKAALGAGFDFLGVETGLVTAEEFKKAGGKSIGSLADLLTG